MKLSQLFYCICFTTFLTGQDLRAEDEVFENFESGIYNGWQITGSAFGDSPSRGTMENQNPVTGFIGKRLVNSFFQGDKSVGSLLSREFTISKDNISFKIGGGAHVNQTCIELWIDNKIVRSATGNDDEFLDWKNWNVKDLKGQLARVRILDSKKDGWGHINIDQIIFCDTPKQKGKTSWSLDEYASSNGYYKEIWRPGIHFTPQINWMNDPNGMVYYDGEFHLFYQYNPFGQKWGHMSWGHAVSSDLFHWKHLPVALLEEDGVMIFSGSAVIDWNNTTGFQKNKDPHPPMVAIYTGHYTNLGHGLQNQHIAYSLDKGRTWTKYDKNPVLDHKMENFRDPKVIWYDHEKCWIMTVCLPLEKKVVFYKSKDLKKWLFLSEFGPAGAIDGIWECPDLFPLQDRDGNEHWVLIVNLNPGSYAGGSGGQYFIGKFDGRTFRPITNINKPLWLDYGKDYYATVTWSDIPESDGRRLSLGWMSNWEYANDLPVAPWRSAMSLPRQWVVSGKGKNLRLQQSLPAEFLGLRRSGKSLDHATVNEANQFIKNQFVDLQPPFEVSATLVPRHSTEPVRISFFNHNTQKTILEIDHMGRMVEFDRSQSGNVSFHPRFPSRTQIPLEGSNKRIHMKAVVDNSSIEIFLNDGLQTITSRVFPVDRGTPITFSGDEKTRLLDLHVWKLKRSMGIKD